MKKFQYLAKDSAGKVTKGEIDAKERDEAADSLTKQGLTPIYVKTAKNRFDIMGRLNEVATIPAAEKVMFSKQLATLVSAGIPIAQSMHILEEQTDNKRMKKAIIEIGQDVENGTALSVAISKFPTIFSPLYSNMIKAGEIGGILDQSLEKMADEIDKEHELVASIRGAMYYPAVIITVMILVVVYMITTIIPQLASVFSQNGAKLPASTQFLIDLSAFVGSYGIYVLVALVGSIYGLRTLIKKNYKARLAWHMLLIKTPVFGKLMKKINIVRFTRTLSSLLAAGVTVLDALKISSDVLSNEVFKKEIDAAAEKVKNGTQLGEALKSSKIFPVIVPQMVSVGEETGTLDKILEKLTYFYQNEVDHTVANLSSLLEPMIMILLGFGVGFIVIAIITPIYSMANTF